jgi:signal transduction histidine kinase
MQSISSGGSAVAEGRLTPSVAVVWVVRAPGLPWLVWGLAMLLVLVAVGFGLLNHLDLYQALDTYLLTLAVSVLTYASVGLLIAMRRPGHRLGWLFLGVGLAVSLPALSGQYARYALLVQPDLPGGAAAAWLYRWAWLLAYPMGVWLVLLFPSGRLLSARWSHVGWLAGGSAGLAMLARALSPGTGPGLPEVANPLGVPGAEWLEIVFALGWVGVLAAFGGALVALVVRLRRSRGAEQQQLKWFVYAVGLLIVGETAAPALIALLRPALAGNATAFTEPVAACLPAIAAAVAVLRYRLYDIDVLIHRTLVYAALTASVVGLYVLVVGYLGAVFRTAGEPVVSLAATGVVAVLFQPLRERLQRGISRLLYGRRDEPYAVLTDLGRRLEAALAPAAVLPTIATTVREALKLPYAAIALSERSGTAVAAEVGRPTEPLLRLPLVYQQEPVGELLLGPRVPGEAFTPGEQRLLQDLARQAGVAVHAVRLSLDLQRARELLVGAREEERRRLRRDLHDGLGPQLASHALALDVARELVPRDPAAAVALLGELQRQSQAAVADIRRLVYDLRPPALDDLGLVGALREQASRYEQGGLRITFQVPEILPPLPAAVEVAIYRIVQEALTNVARHAQARTCVVRLAVRTALEPLALCAEIEDDGVGCAPGYRAGVGLVSMRERAAELGGTCTVEAPPGGGTRVVAVLPRSTAGSRSVLLEDVRA